MNSAKKLLMFLLVLILAAAGPALAQSAGTSPEGFHWEIGEEGLLISGYEGSSRELTIPAEIDGHPVRAIGEEAFAESQLSRVSLPNSLISIGAGAFYDNQLGEITIPASVTYIGTGAFMYNPLIRVSLGANVQLGSWVFGNGFEALYNNSARAAGTYARPNAESRDWARR